MAGAAANLFRETVDPLLYLALNGYKIRIVGHSLGGGVAALLGILLLRHFEKQGIHTRSMSSNSVIPSDDGGFVHVYSYGTPSCVDARLADNPM
jgi:pimeloyl-ACP methyl ester carboxylesterase